MGISLPMTYAEAVPKVKRSTLYESYKQVLDDLEQAEKYIPAERSVADSPYFSIGAVNALRARVCLYMLDYEGAVKAATKVRKPSYIGRCHYSLCYCRRYSDIRISIYVEI